MDLRHIADAYNQAARSGGSPLAAVATLTGKSKATASRYVESAREIGLIDRELGESGHISARAMRVAQAIGVPYDLLVAAVIEHADGDLRLGTRTRR